MKTIEDIRHKRLLQILKEQCSDSMQLFAKQTGKKYPQVYQWVNRTKCQRNGTPRSFGSKTARIIEKSFGKRFGWMDSLSD